MNHAEFYYNMGYQENDEVMESLTIARIDKDGSDTRPKICLNCFYCGFFGHACSFNKNDKGYTIDIPVDSLGTCNNYVAAPFQM
jgi:hypothetical protein